MAAIPAFWFAGWSVEVKVWGKRVVLISDEVVSGKDITKQDEATIQAAIEHLRGFIGDKK